MKYRRIRLLMGVLLGVLAAKTGEHPREAFAVQTVPTLKASRAIAVELAVEPSSPLRMPEKPVDYVGQPVPDVALTPPTRRWILRDETWKSMANSRFNLDVSVMPGEEYIGLRVVLPFGS